MNQGRGKAVLDVISILRKEKMTALQLAERRNRTLQSTHGLLNRMKADGLVRIAGYAKDHRTYENGRPPFIWGLGNKPDTIYQKKPRDKVESDYYLSHRAIILAKKRSASGKYKANIWSGLLT